MTRDTFKAKDTIGDEKVVGYLADTWPAYRFTADSHPPATYPVVRFSAYAELAADRDLWRSMATFEGKVSASVLDDLHTTQAQLAELRGRVSVMLEKWSADSGKHPGTIESIVMKAICAELSTLAAADGATTGEMKCPTP